MAKTTFDYADMSASQLMELVKQKKQEEANDPKRIERIKELKEKFEKECKKEGLTLAQVFTFSEKRLEPVKGSEPGQVWYRRGPKPQWLKDFEAKEQAESEGATAAMKSTSAYKARAKG